MIMAAGLLAAADWLDCSPHCSLRTPRITNVINAQFVQSCLPPLLRSMYHIFMTTLQRNRPKNSLFLGQQEWGEVDYIGNMQNWKALKDVGAREREGGSNV